MISFYTSENTKQKFPNTPLNDNSPMIPNAQMKFKNYTNATKRANKDYQKRRGNG